MDKKKKGALQSIPGWTWVLISLAAAVLSVSYTHLTLPTKLEV